MKRILLKFATILAILPSIIMFSCEEPMEDCEKYDYGYVTVENNTGYKIWVDVTYQSSGENYEKMLWNNDQYRYKMNSGKVYIWASFDGNDWVYDTYYVSACDDLTYTWYLDKKKSTNGLYLEISNESGVLRTVSEFQRLQKD